MGIIENVLRNKPKESAPTGKNFGSHSETSVNHPNRNEDACFVNTRSGGVFDGISGNPPTGVGDKAAQIAKDCIQSALAGIPDSISQEEAQRLVRQAFKEADREVVNQGKRSSYGLQFGTTGTAFVEHANSAGEKMLTIGHAGDSRLYYFTKGKLVSLTVDQIQAFADTTQSRALRLQEELDESDNPNKVLIEAGLEKRNTITSYLGSGEVDESMAIMSVLIDVDGLILVVSDGLSNQLKGSEIQKILSEGIRKHKSPGELCVLLVTAANKTTSARAKIDDVTAVIKEISPNNTNDSSSREAQVNSSAQEQIRNAQSLREVVFIGKKLCRTGEIKPEMMPVLNMLAAGQSVQKENITSAFGLREIIIQLAPNQVR